MSSVLSEPLPDFANVARVRRLTVADALDEGLRIVHENYRDLIRAALIVSLLPMMAATYYGIPAAEEFWFAFLTSLDGQSVDIRPYAWRFVGLTLPLMTLAYRIAEPLCLGALVVLSAGVLSGQRVTIRAALGLSARNGIPLVVMWSLRWLAVQFGTLFCYLPGIIVAALFLCALPAIVLEQKGPLRAMGRSVELNGRRFWEAILLVLLLGLIDVLILQWAQMLPRGWPQAAAHALLHASTLVLYAATVTAFYLSGRCQLEHYDLQVWTQSIVQRDAQTTADEFMTLDLYPRV